jgi:hypothetical protein
MKNFIKLTIAEKIKNNETPAMDFITSRDDIGHIQFDQKSWGNDWAIFFNSKCVHTSKTLNSAVKKLKELGVTNFDLQLEQFKNFF